MAVQNFENQRFKELLDAAGWSQTEAARKLHVSEGSISAYVKGPNPPPKSRMALLERLVIEERSGGTLINESEIEYKVQPDTRFEGFSVDTLEAMYSSFLGLFAKAKPNERRGFLEQLLGIVAEIDRQSKKEPS